MRWDELDSCKTRTATHHRSTRTCRDVCLSSSGGPPRPDGQSVSCLLVQSFCSFRLMDWELVVVLIATSYRHMVLDKSNWFCPFRKNRSIFCDSSARQRVSHFHSRLDVLPRHGSLLCTTPQLVLH
jgi:hypothetical protein